jgi:hypothetical protein
VADRPRFQADVAVQYCRRLVDTFNQFTRRLHSKGDNRVKMIRLKGQIIQIVFL